MGNLDIIEALKYANNVEIYGAGIVAYGIYEALVKVYGVVPKFFIVTDKGENINEIDHIPVISIEEIKYREIGLVLIATPEIYHAEIAEVLKENGITDVIYVNSELESFMMSAYFRMVGGFPLLDKVLSQNKKNITSDTRTKIVKNDDIGIYMVQSPADKPLKHEYDLQKWLRSIQAGASLTDARIAEITDYNGDHISAKNRNYCELTATYWVWKNTFHKYKGICHYRRILMLDENEIRKLLESDIDVILPFPYVCPHHTSEQFGRYISSENFQAAMKALEELSPEYYEAAKKVYAGRYLYNHNILVAKEKIFNDYCAWMFPILERVEEICEPNGRKRNDRYMGYIGEILMALYMLHNRDRLKLAHVGIQRMI